MTVSLILVHIFYLIIFLYFFWIYIKKDTIGIFELIIIGIFISCDLTRALNYIKGGQ